MMKFVIALVALFYLCYSAPVNMNLNREILRGLETLNKQKFNVTSFSYPGKIMRDNAPSCVVTFIEHLNGLIDNVTVPDGNRTLEVHKGNLKELEGHGNRTLEVLKGNLKALKVHEGNNQNQNDPRCKMEESRNTSKPFKQYLNFIKKLNNSNNK